MDMAPGIIIGTMQPASGASIPDPEPASLCGSLRVEIGILARNEADGLGTLLQDIARQTLLTHPDIDLSISVIANGCTDNTAEIGRRGFQDPAFQKAKTVVHELEQAGKSNAWNVFHTIIPDGTDFVFFLDGDIRIPQPHALEAVLNGLLNAPKAFVAVDRSVKDLETEEPRNWAEWLIKKATGTANDTRTAIAGALYCVRFHAIEPIWMPIGLPGEDGFLRAMLLTSSFAHDEEISRLVFIEDAYHIFESTRSVSDVVNHNVRLAIGTAVNILLFHELRRVRSTGQSISSYIIERNCSDQNWINALMAQRLQLTYFPLQPRFLLRRLQQPRNRRSVGAFTTALFGTMFDVVVFIRATILMRRGAGAGYW
jgi:glycosyltransferase involved in cell wall biosynthesis